MSSAQHARGGLAGVVHAHGRRLTLEQLDDTFAGYRYTIDADNPDVARVASGSQAPVVTRWMTTGFALPFTMRSTIRYATGLEHILLLLTTPIDDVTSYFTFVVWRNDDFSVPADEVVAFDRRIGLEDKTMLERIPGVCPSRSLPRPVYKQTVLPWHGAASSPPCSKGELRAVQ